MAIALVTGAYGFGFSVNIDLGAGIIILLLFLYEKNPGQNVRDSY